MSPKTTPMHASAAGAQACVVVACAAVPIFSATAIAAIHCPPMKHSWNMAGRKPGLVASSGAASLHYCAPEIERETTRCPLWLKAEAASLDVRFAYQSAHTKAH